MRKMLYIANIRMPTEKAHGVQIMRMCSAFAKLGIEVELAVTSRTTITGEPFSYYGVPRNFLITRIPSFDVVKWGWIGYWFQAISFAFMATSHALRGRYDIIYGRDELPLFILSFFTKRIVWEVHTKKENPFVSRVLQKSVLVITISPGLKEFYTTKHFLEENKIKIFHDAVSLEAFEELPGKKELREWYALPLNARIVGYVGKYKTMGEPKGVEEIIDAVAKVQRELPDVFLLLVGINPKEEEEVIERIQQAGMTEEKFRIVLHVPAREVFGYYTLCDLLVMNYPASEHYTRFMSPLKLFEYMASGVPIVTTDLPTVREILNERNAFLTIPENINELVSAITTALTDTTQSKERALQARCDVERYSWEARARGILDQINESLRVQKR